MMTACTEQRIDGFFSDVWDTVTSPFVAGADFVASLPGFSQAGELVKDFANTATGKIVLRAMATAFAGPLGAIVGPQLATIAWAIPGLLRGDDFEDAWYSEFRDRVEKTAEILGPEIAPELMSQLETAMGELAAEWKIGDRVTWTLEELARRSGVRDDVAAFAISLWNHTDLPAPDGFDPQTGRFLVLSERPGILSQAVLASNQIRATDRARRTALSSSNFLSFAAANDLDHPSAATVAASSFRVTPASAPAPAPVRGVAPSSGGIPTAAIVAGGVAALAGVAYFAFGTKKRRRR